MTAVQKEKHLLIDVTLLAISIFLAIYVVETGIAHAFVSSLDGLGWFGIFFVGMFFTSAFTTAPAIVLLGEFAQTNPLWVVVLLGALGAVIGDYVIFRFMKDRVADDFNFLISSPKGKRLRHVFHRRLFHYLMPFLGALVIASPLPDELGIAMIGISRVKNSSFFILSFVFNAAGIFIIGTIARAAIGF